ncbi:hypothetical protein P0082_02985 [Candidatus Haliotispira prima]|uniref:DNRLRE domain-containing protein n=1 Tax=Candidatus Haliotispira prima TaxID=3034016 RepID=A0ABY8MIK0_9SPIO|nr:hypothetical protein P0082_02985 [Candidatus Haliotispira prima]
MFGCAPISDDSNDPPAASPVKSTVSLTATAVVSSVRLEMSSTLAIANIGAVIRLATEAAPTKTQAEANAGYVNLEITAGGTRKFSISQHYGSDFTNGLTLADVLTANTQYKLYLFFDPNAINPIAGVDGVTLTNGVAALSFITATLPSAGDVVWNDAWTNEQFVGSLPEWSYSQNQKGVFVAYTKINFSSFTGISFTSRAANDILSQSIGFFAFSRVSSTPGFIFNISKLGGSYPDSDGYYYVISADDTRTVLGNAFMLEITETPPPATLIVPLTRYSSP